MIRLAVLLALAAAPVAAQPACPFPNQTPQLVVQMFFGQTINGPAGKRLISRRVWQAFVADTITSALPGGFTVTDGYGQYQDPVTRVIGREPTELVIVAAPDSDTFRARIEAIASAYRTRFAQRAVGIVSTSSCAAF